MFYLFLRAVSSGISGAAFHGLIHLGYGMSINNTQLILEGMTYLAHSYLPFKYCPSETAGPTVKSMLELLEMVKREDKLRQIVMDNYENEEIQSRTPGAFQRGMICLSVYGQECISNYTARLIQNIPKMRSESDLYAVRKWLLKNMIMVYTFGDGIDTNDFFILHGVTSCWSLCEIFKYLEAENVNKAMIEFVNAVVAAYVVQGAPDVKIMDDRSMSEDYMRKQIAKIVYGLLYEIESNDTYKDEHVYKLIQVILECLEEDIIDLSCAYYAINKSMKELDFTSITTPYIAKKALGVRSFISSNL